MGADMDAKDLGRIADALERVSPPPIAAPDFTSASAFVWNVNRYCAALRNVLCYSVMI